MTQLPLFTEHPEFQELPPSYGSRAVERQFPTALVSRLAEHESWRKEIYRPLSYIHKWWARRLGSVFRAIIIAGSVGADDDVAGRLFQRVAFPDTVVYDPFMGSGVTVHEAVKLGCRIIGRDINPVAYTMVRTALEPHDRAAVLAAYESLERTVAPRIRALYHCTLPGGAPADVLYYFWVKVLSCPRCATSIDLFKRRIFARHAYPKQYPAAQALCPECGAINVVNHDATTVACGRCGAGYNPQQGVFQGTRAVCPHCQHGVALIDAVRALGAPLEHRLYAKLALTPAGEKLFLPAEPDDLARYFAAERQLPDFWRHIPQEAIAPGYNTNQVLNYNYRFWHQMFNARQLAALGMLGAAITALPDPQTRRLLACLFSGMLEFNNMFASFKGIGTGAVRHMFAHHILKPELTPLEANPWGTHQSSGAFSTLFESRILRALDYKERPYELRVPQRPAKPTGEKVYGLTLPVSIEPAGDFATFARGARAYLSVGDSAQTDIGDGTVDLVITDPPFFDNVHYSQLADFFHVWLRRLLPEEPALAHTTTRSEQEVQQTDASRFAERLGGVLGECRRVLKNSGLLIFTYHHARTEGWTALHTAIRQAGFVTVKAHPVKAEMAVSVPVQQAKEPVNLDLIIVCRKATQVKNERADVLPLESCLAEARAVVLELQSGGQKLSVGDAKVVLMGCVLARLAVLGACEREIATLLSLEGDLDGIARTLIGHS
ncbi:MAG TPA: DNA methyltransferase [Chloroflexaceae bacterium]|nr:DNA methyltransferase [Chloroflexaceae bacterium]